MENEPSTSSKKRIRLSGIPGVDDCESIDKKTICFEELLPCQLDELGCPICNCVIENAYVTECGHTYCFKCIIKSLETTKFCPKCGYIIHKVHPNFMIDKFIKVRRKADNLLKLTAGSNSDQSAWYKLVLEKTQNLDPDDVNYLVELLLKKKKKQEKSSKVIKFELLKEFLKNIHIRKQKQLNKLADELKIIRVDFKILNRVESSLIDEKDDQPANDSSTSTSYSESSSTSLSTSVESESSQANLDINDYNSETNVPKSTDVSSYKDMKLDEFLAQLDGKKNKIKLLYDDLEEYYLNLRTSVKSEYTSSSSPKTPYSPLTNKIGPDELDEFGETLYMTTFYGSFVRLGTLFYPDESSDPYNPSNLVSSIEFDKDGEIFAIGGIAKIIKLYDYSKLIKKDNQPNPIAELPGLAKISSLCFSKYYKSLMVSGDYEGTVTVWDTSTKQPISSFYEHLKRCWSVDFNRVDIKLIASGSDDASVKLWSLNMDNSVLTLKGYNTNVCGVKFHPSSRYHVAFSSADNMVYYYDLRNPSKPQCTLKGHHSAVSYVQFMSSSELVSLSTDNTCKLWNFANEKPLERSFKGHFNSKKFVGLATNNEYICCGSENNALYIYYKGFSKPILNYSFDFGRPISANGLEVNWTSKDVNQKAMTAVCWKAESNVILAGNSGGTVKILEIM